MGGTVWTDCGSACTRFCATPPFQPCTKQCVPKCECPPEKPILNDEGTCVTTCQKKILETNLDSEGIIAFNSNKIVKALKKSSSHKIGMRLILNDENDELPSLPYSMTMKYSALRPKEVNKRPSMLKLDVYVEKDEDKPVIEGDVITIRIKLKNIHKQQGKDSPVSMVVAIIGIPGGFEPRSEQLKELKDSNLVDFIETKPGSVILYWRALSPNFSHEIPISITAVIPGDYLSPSSQAYCYYFDEEKTWAPGFNISVLKMPNVAV